MTEQGLTARTKRLIAHRKTVMANTRIEESRWAAQRTGIPYAAITTAKLSNLIKALHDAGF